MAAAAELAAEVEAELAKEEVMPRSAAAVDDQLKGAADSLHANGGKSTARVTTEEERAAAAKLIERSAGLSEFDAIRFLRARQLDVAKAHALYAADQDWRRAGIAGTNGSIPLDRLGASDCKAALSTGCDAASRTAPAEPARCRVRASG